MASNTKLSALSNKKLNEGQALMTAVIFFLIISLIILAGLSVSSLVGSVVSRDLIKTKTSYFTAEAGIEDAAYRILSGKNYTNQEVIRLNGSFATTTISDVGGDQELVSISSVSENIRKVKVVLSHVTGIAFHYGVQVGDGGVTMDQSAKITGNLYSNGPVDAFSANVIGGDAVSAGPSGFVTGVHATGTVYSHTIANSNIDGNAYYYDNNISGSTVWGTSYPDSADQPSLDLPITDELIETWKAAASTTVISSPCPYVIDSAVDIGPVKIECDLEITGTNFTVTVGGPVWVEGSINVVNSPNIKVNSALGKKSVPIIADNHLNRLTGSKVSLRNSATFENSGTDGSYILLISQNNSAENGGTENAVTIEQTVGGTLLLYAGHGRIFLNNRSDLREVTGYAIKMRNQANVIYETGLASLLFESGPGGTFSISAWREIE